MIVNNLSVSLFLMMNALANYVALENTMNARSGAKIIGENYLLA